MVIRRFGVYLARLNPVVGREIGKTRPCVVISPDTMHRFLSTVVIAPLTSAQKGYPTRVACEFLGKHGEIALDQIRTLDRSRFVKFLGALEARNQAELRATLVEMFS